MLRGCCSSSRSRNDIRAGFLTLLQPACDPDEPVAVRVFSMTVAANIAKDEPELMDELRLVATKYPQAATAGFRSRSRACWAFDDAMKQRKGEYEIDTDKRRLDLAGIHRFLSTGIVLGEEPHARADADRDREFALLWRLSRPRTGRICTGGHRQSDVRLYRRCLYSRRTSRPRPEQMADADDRRAAGHAGAWRWLLATRDAHGLYEQFGFSALVHPERWMERTAPDAY